MDSKGDVALKYDEDKIDWLIMPYVALEEVSKVMVFGQRKYFRGNYRNGFEYLRLLNAAMRHIISFARGEDKDPESGLSHLAHACCCILMLMTNIAEGKGVDNRKETII